MARRKKSTRSAGRSPGVRSGSVRGSAGRAPTRSPVSPRGAARGGTDAKGAAKQGRSAGETPARQGKNLQDVTTSIQRRWDRGEEDVPTPPSSLDLDRRASAAASGRERMKQRQRKHTAPDPTITGGDVDADGEQAYFAGDESPTADNPTPDQSEVEGIGRAAGLDYEDTEELKSTPKVDRRDKKRWELDPASSEDYKERNRKRGS